MSQYLHSSVHPEAKIGGNVIIEPFATVERDVEIGEGTWIGANAVIKDGARIGKNCRIHHGAVIAGNPQDLKFGGEFSTAEIGDNTTIREFVTVNRGTAASGKLRTLVGSGVLLMSYVHVAHDCVIGSNAILSGYVGLAGEVEVGEYAVIGGGTLAHQFSRIGMHSMVSGGVSISKDIPPFILAGHTPPSFFGVNKIGLERRGFSSEQINYIHDLYRIIYQSNKNISQACEALAQMPPSAECSAILQFITSSKRGVIGREKKTANRSVEF